MLQVSVPKPARNRSPFSSVIAAGVLCFSAHGFAAVGEITPQSIASAITTARQAVGSVGFEVVTTRTPVNGGQPSQLWQERVAFGTGAAVVEREYTRVAAGVARTTTSVASTVDASRFMLISPGLQRAWLATDRSDLRNSGGGSANVMSTTLAGWDVLGDSFGARNHDDVVSELLLAGAVVDSVPVLVGNSVCVVVTTRFHVDGSPAFQWAFDVARNFAPTGRWVYGSQAEGSPLLVSYEVSEFFDAGGGLFLPARASGTEHLDRVSQVEVSVTHVMTPTEVESLLESADNVPSGTTVADLDSGEVWIASSDIEGVVDQALAALPADARHAAARWPVVEILAGCAGVGLGLALWGGRRRSTPR